MTTKIRKETRSFERAGHMLRVFATSREFVRFLDYDVKKRQDVTWNRDVTIYYDVM